MGKTTPPHIPLPKGWPKHVRLAMLHVVALAQYATAYTRSWAANSVNERMRLRADNDRLYQEVALLREEIRIKDSRIALIRPPRRPHYPPVERMSILELRAARGWTLESTATVFLVTAPTIASWMRRLDDQGPDALVQLREPVNRFPDFVRYAVQRLKQLCPHMGKVKIAQMLCRAGLHLGPTTVGRMLKEPPTPEPLITPSSGRVVTAQRPNHVWHVDLTTVPLGAGLWAPWLPFALPQCWPFCWWVALIIDHYSRRGVGFAVFQNRPNARAMQIFLGRAIQYAGAKPRYLVSDQDPVFIADDFRDWLHWKRIKPRYGAVGQHGSIAVIERFIRTLKDEGTRRILVPSQRNAFCREIRYFIDWYNDARPHSALDGRTPNEVYRNQPPANQRPRIEPRRHWHRRSPCAKPNALIAGKPGNRFTLEVTCRTKHPHLPIVSLRRAA